jgi:hypothetical protein
MGYADYTPEEVASRGEAIYEERIRPLVAKGNEGKFVIIDIESCDYELDDDDLTATMRLLEKRPEAVIYGLRVGYPAAYDFGGHIRIESQ